MAPGRVPPHPALPRDAARLGVFGVRRSSQPGVLRLTLLPRIGGNRCDLKEFAVPKIVSAVVMALVVSFVAIRVIREKSALVDTRITGLLNATPPPSVSPRDLNPIAMTLAMETTASASAGPASVFAVFVAMRASMAGQSLLRKAEPGQVLSRSPDRSP